MVPRIVTRPLAIVHQRRPRPWQSASSMRIYWACCSPPHSTVRQVILFSTSKLTELTGAFVVLYCGVVYILFFLRKDSQSKKSAALVIVTVMMIVATLVSVSGLLQLYVAHGFSFFVSISLSASFVRGRLSLT